MFSFSLEVEQFIYTFYFYFFFVFRFLKSITIILLSLSAEQIFAAINYHSELFRNICSAFKVCHQKVEVKEEIVENIQLFSAFFTFSLSI